jgi:hypothetical protein
MRVTTGQCPRRRSKDNRNQSVKANSKRGDTAEASPGKHPADEGVRTSQIKRWTANQALSHGWIRQASARVGEIKLAIAAPTGERDAG